MIHRRSLLQSAIALTASAASMPALRAFENPSEPGYVDAHVHVWSPDVVRYPLGAKFKTDDMKPASFTPEQLFVHTRANGVAKIVLIQMNFYDYDNSYMLDCIEKYPGVFKGVAVIDEKQSDLGRTMKKLYSGGIRGFRLYSDAKNAASWITSESMKRMWGFAADLNQSVCLLANPDSLASIEKLCEQYSKTKIVIDHFARIGMNGAIVGSELDQLCRLARFERVFVKTSAFYALGKKRAPYTDLSDMIKRLVAAFGVDRLMWASDCPYQVENGHTYEDSLALVRDKIDFLSVDDKQWILRRTASNVFDI